MTHIKGHIQNSALRRGDDFPLKGGVLFPIPKQEVFDVGDKTIEIEGKKKSLGYPIIFLNNHNIDLKFYQEVWFHPKLIAPAPGNKWFVIAINIITSKTLNKEQEDAETYYSASRSFELVYDCDLSTRKRKRSDDEVISWILNNCVPFDRINLATN